MFHGCKSNDGVLKFIIVGYPKHMLLRHKSNESVQESIIVCNPKQMFPSHESNDKAPHFITLK
jgi:hypothetical protein